MVNRVAKCFRRVKVGHAGTLDPLATGVLVVAVGGATRLIEYVQRMQKTYRTVVRLGARSDTDDADGTVTQDPDAAAPTADALRAAVMTQVGDVMQKPPGYSALKVAGRRAYDLARAGQIVDLAPRPVHIGRIDVLAYDWPKVTLEVVCGGGTYIRSIARDVGERLGCGGLVEVLERTRIGPFLVGDAASPDDVSAETVPRLLRPATEAVAGLPSLTLSADQVADVVQGRDVDAGAREPGEVVLLGPDGALVAIGEAVGGRVRPRRVLVSG